MKEYVAVKYTFPKGTRVRGRRWFWRLYSLQGTRKTIQPTAALGDYDSLAKIRRSFPSKRTVVVRRSARDQFWFGVK